MVPEYTITTRKYGLGSTEDGGRGFRHGFQSIFLKKPCQNADRSRRPQVSFRVSVNVRLAEHLVRLAVLKGRLSD